MDAAGGLTTPRPAATRYVGSWPKIGIRPAIDGRRNGVRESLEGQTMGLARAAAEFLSANLRYPDGRPVILGFHGCSCLADTIAMGFRRAQNLEQAAMTTFRCIQLGNTSLTFPPEWFDRLATV